MLQGDSVTRDVVAELIRGAVDDVVRSQLARRAQEAPISSKIAAMLETRLHGMNINGYRVTAVAQDFRDRGAKSDESKSGADLYIGIRVEPGRGLPSISKGMLIQAKKRVGTSPPASSASAARKSYGKRQMDLVGQCEKMLASTDKGAFVWVYGSVGTHVVPASEVVAHPGIPPDYLAGRNVSEQFRDVLDCFLGDEDLVGAGIFDDESALGDFLAEIAVRSGVTMRLASLSGDEVPR